MKFIAARCPSCNGDLQIPDDRDFVKCMYCSSDIKVREVINLKTDKSEQLNLWKSEYHMNYLLIMTKGIPNTVRIESIIKCLTLCINIITTNDTEYQYNMKLVTMIILYYKVQNKVPIINFTDNSLYWVENVSIYEHQNWNKAFSPNFFNKSEQWDAYFELFITNCKYLVAVDKEKSLNLYTDQVSQFYMAFINNILENLNKIFIPQNNVIRLANSHYFKYEKELTYSQESYMLSTIIGYYCGIILFLDNLYDMIPSEEYKKKIRELSKLCIQGGYYLKEVKGWFSTNYENCKVRTPNNVQAYLMSINDKYI